jgi:hypothetical protein
MRDQHKPMTVKNMTQNRFSQQSSEPNAPLSTAGFLVVPVATADSCPAASPLQWLYQQLYAQAVQTNQRPATRELFTVMN